MPCCGVLWAALQLQFRLGMRDACCRYMVANQGGASLAWMSLERYLFTRSYQLQRCQRWCSPPQAECAMQV